MEPAFPRTALFVTAGLLIWAADFLFIYIFAAVACARGYADTTIGGFELVPFASAISSIVALAASVAVAIVAERRRRPAAGGYDAFPRRLALIVTVLGAIAVAMLAVPGLLVERVCG